MDPTFTYTAFAGDRLVASGDIRNVLSLVKTHTDKVGETGLLIFEDRTGKQLELDLRGTPEQAQKRLDGDPDFAAALAQDTQSVPQPPRVGRPKLGVISREVSLLPRHWEWLDRQPSGISAALRKLVEHASKAGRAREAAREARDATFRFMNVMAGNLPKFEEACRALYAKDSARLQQLIKKWPKDIRAHTTQLVQLADRLET